MSVAPFISFSSHHNSLAVWGEESVLTVRPWADRCPSEMGHSWEAYRW